MVDEHGMGGHTTIETDQYHPIAWLCYIWATLYETVVILVLKIQGCRRYSSHPTDLSARPLALQEQRNTLLITGHFTYQKPAVRFAQSNSVSVPVFDAKIKFCRLHRVSEKVWLSWFSEIYFATS